MRILDEDHMLRLGAAIAQASEDTAIIFLHGNLGAGKTTFVRGFLRGLGFHGVVKSPTYTLVESYEIDNKTVYHFDFYRLQDPQELEFLGIRDYFQPQTICLVEWPLMGLSKPDVECYFEFAENAREMKLVPVTARGEQLLQRVTMNDK